MYGICVHLKYHQVIYHTHALHMQLCHANSNGIQNTRVTIVRYTVHNLYQINFHKLCMRQTGGGVGAFVNRNCNRN